MFNWGDIPPEEMSERLGEIDQETIQNVVQFVKKFWESDVLKIPSISEEERQELYQKYKEWLLNYPQCIECE